MGVASAINDSRAAHDRLGKPVAVAMLLVGALTSYIGVATLEMSHEAFWSQLGLAIGLTVFGVLIAVTKRRPWLQQIGVLWAVMSVSGMLATADDFGTTPFFFLWPAVYAAYFLSVRFLVVTLVAVGVTLTGALVISEIEWAVKIDILIGTTVCTGLMAGLVAIMHGREERLNALLTEAAHTDALTGLMNRRGFDQRFIDHVADVQSSGLPLAVVMLDLDHFKRFNDDRGHVVGDEALRRMAAILQRHARPADLIARFGGEEFVVVLPGVEAVAARSYAERVSWALGAEAVDHSLRLSTSSGVADAEPGDTVLTLLDRADRALYAAKDGGRARSACWIDGAIEVGEPIDVPEPPAITIELPSVPGRGDLRPVPDPVTGQAATGEASPPVPPVTIRRSA